ncbi:MAG: Gfo/Idh/MocA family oxidoreductase [Bacteroidales bacterium]|nr:Gfo/Idh/MocA family oxidoreductase [Bacteroidales bacterium]
MCKLVRRYAHINDVSKVTGYTPKGEKDIRRLLEHKDLDAVVIATPDHWHAPAAIMAMQAGKHVYLEKPTSHNPAENEMLLKAAAKYRSVVQAGNQRRSCNSTPSEGNGLGVAFYGEKGTMFFSGGNEYKIVDLKGNVIKEEIGELKFEPGNLVNPCEKLYSRQYEKGWEIKL